MSAVALAVALAMPSVPLCAAPLTPKAAFDLALQQTPELVRSRARVAEAKGAVKEAKGHLLPSLDLNVTASTSNDPLNVFGMKLQQRQATFNDFGAGQFLAGVDNPDIVNEEVHDLNYPGWYQNFQTELQLQVPIYNGGQVWGGVHRAEAMLAAARHGERLAQQKILFEVIRLFEGNRTAEGYRKAAAQGVEAAGSYLKLTEKLYAHGVVAETDVLQARVHLGDARLTEAEARKQQAVAMEGLRVLTGTGDNEPLVLAPGPGPRDRAPGRRRPTATGQAGGGGQPRAGCVPWGRRSRRHRRASPRPEPPIGPCQPGSVPGMERPAGRPGQLFGHRRPRPSVERPRFRPPRRRRGSGQRQGDREPGIAA
jgi:hypothetical protein